MKLCRPYVQMDWIVIYILPCSFFSSTHFPRNREEVAAYWHPGYAVQMPKQLGEDNFLTGPILD